MNNPCECGVILYSYGRLVFFKTIAANETELVWYGSRTNLKKLSQAETILYLGSITIESEAVVLNLGVYIDNELKMLAHKTKVAAMCFIIFIVFTNYNLS